MPHLEFVEFENFRGFESFRLGELGGLNLLTGPNNVGKTAVLEAIFMLSSPRGPAISLNVNAKRGLQTFRIQMTPGVGLSETPWAFLFHRGNTIRPIRLTGKPTVGAAQTLTMEQVYAAELTQPPGQIHLPDIVSDWQVPREQPTLVSAAVPSILKWSFTQEPDRAYYFYPAVRSDGQGITLVQHPMGGIPFFNCYYFGAWECPVAPELNERFTAAVQAGKRGDLVRTLSQVEPRIEGLEILQHVGGLVLHADLRGVGFIPLWFTGAGLARVLNILLGIQHIGDGVVLVDEIENGIHYSNLPTVWRLIAEAARDSGAQIIATTHSRECVEAANDALKEMSFDDFRLHRMESGPKGKVASVSYDLDTLDAAVQSGLEFR